ncbi:hypothetical protein [Agrobacterium tumefaciens]|uniref:Uncharacterized protein n=1 Tax=Agrobacterium tumefaciens TaxID=358 RepID=A0A176WWX9_AGRTU|nr:hypothetical protein [Agrobacterium tumefaciens]OAE37659.1 hypothetical protein A7J57_08760 [Agrobacterium tumefaciens]
MAAKKTIALNEALFPQVPLKYKELPVTNGDGRKLSKCQKCEGRGTIATAERTVEQHNKQPRKERFGVEPRDVKSWEKKGYTCSVSDCSACRGAGLIVGAE